MTTVVYRSDIVVFGSTPCGIAAAIAAARCGRSVSLVTAAEHVGGMMSSGLSITDLRFRHAFGGIFREFAGLVQAHYVSEYGPKSEQARLCSEGIWFEPHIAERIFERMLAAESHVAMYKNRRLVQAIREGAAVAGLIAEHRDTGAAERYEARVSIDGSYEGDLAAAAGVPCRVGREAREEFYEPYAGFIFLKNPGLQVLEGSTGEGDRLVQAYNFRLCLTNRDDLRVPPQKPDAYAREEYAPLVPLCREGKLKSLNDVIRLAPIPNGKFNGNNRPIVRSLDLPGANTDYPEGDERTREAIVRRYRDYMTGLLWFLQHDPELSEELRAEAGRWGFCKDEFADNGHVPYELYIREARRIVGRKTFTSHDAFLAPGSERAPVHDDAVAVGDYHVDSHLVQRQQPGWPQIEGHVYLRALSKPAHIPFGVMLPREVEGLLVPGALSATHLGFSVLRMEPPWMALGQAAGTAAHLALALDAPPAEVPVPELQRLLLEAGQVITFFYDVPGPDPIWTMLNMPGELTKQDVQIETAPRVGEHAGLQYFGTKGFFNSYYARPYDAVTRSEAARWLGEFLKLEGVGIAELGKPEAAGAVGTERVSGPGANGRNGAEAAGGVSEAKQARESIEANEGCEAKETRASNGVSEAKEANGADEGQPFADIGPAHPDRPAVEPLRRLGIVDGWLGTAGFYPGAALSRADAARWVAQAKRLAGAWPAQPEGSEPETAASTGAGRSGSSAADASAAISSDVSTETAAAARWSDLPPDHADAPHFRLLCEHDGLPRGWMSASELQPLTYVTREEFCELLYRVHVPVSKEKMEVEQ